MTIGNRIALLRARTTRREFAATLGISESTLRNYEQGTSLPNSDVIADICEIYSVSADWLVRGFFPHDSESGEECPDAPVSNLPRAGLTDIPVIGLAACGFEGWYNPDRVALKAQVPADWARSGMFAVIAVGKSMEPEGIRQGFVVICDPGAVPKRGDVIYLERKDLDTLTLHASLKKFVGKDDRWMYLSSWDRNDVGILKKEHAQLDLDYVTGVAVAVMVKRKA